MSASERPPCRTSVAYGRKLRQPKAVHCDPRSAASLLAGALESAPVADLLVDILSASGDAEWREVEVDEARAGAAPQLPNSVVIAVRRGSRLLWPWQPAAQRLERGDRLVVVRATTPLPGAPVR